LISLSLCETPLAQVSGVFAFEAVSRQLSAISFRHWMNFPLLTADR
jgi:hypothetical protein